MITSAIPLAVTVACLVWLGATGNLFSASPFVIAAQLAAVALNVWARRSFAKGAFRVSAAPVGSSVMSRGPYRIVRHPMYSSVLLFMWAGIASHASAVTVCVGMVLSVLVALRVVAEEKLLIRRFPDYQAYARTTKALVPYLF